MALEANSSDYDARWAEALEPEDRKARLLSVLDEMARTLSVLGEPRWVVWLTDMRTRFAWDEPRAHIDYRSEYAGRRRFTLALQGQVDADTGELPPELAWFCQAQIDAWCLATAVGGSDTEGWLRRADRTRELVESARLAAPDEDWAFIDELVRVGELGVAVESLLAIVFEQAISLPPQFSVELASLADEMRVGDGYLALSPAAEARPAEARSSRISRDGISE